MCMVGVFIAAPFEQDYRAQQHHAMIHFMTHMYIQQNNNKQNSPLHVYRQATISGSPRSSPAFPAVSSPASRNSGAAPHGGHGVRSDWLPSARQHQPHPQQHQERPSHDHAHAAAAYTTANGPDVLYSPRPIYSDLPSANAHMDGVAEVAARLHTESALAAAQEEKRRERYVMAQTPVHARAGTPWRCNNFRTSLGSAVLILSLV